MTGGVPCKGGGGESRTMWMGVPCGSTSAWMMQIGVAASQAGPPGGCRARLEGQEEMEAAGRAGESEGGLHKSIHRNMRVWLLGWCGWC